MLLCPCWMKAVLPLFLLIQILTRRPDLTKSRS
nr:MAG TPA: hypothetical protein [Caudoviricetes sp.]